MKVRPLNIAASAALVAASAALPMPLKAKNINNNPAGIDLVQSGSATSISQNDHDSHASHESHESHSSHTSSSY